MSSTTINPGNQAMEPVGIVPGALTGHESHDGHGHDDHAAPAEAKFTPNAGMYQPFQWAEIVGGVGLLGFVLALIAGMCLAMAGGMALLIKGLKLAGMAPEAATLWGNAVGSVALIVLVFVMVLATLLTMGERKWSAFIQDRMGPNRARFGFEKHLPGPLKDTSLWGLPHIAADVFKMLTKEEIVPAQGNKVLFHLAPALAFGPAFVLFAVIPMSPTIMFLGERITMQVAQVYQGLLYIFAIASVAVLGTSLAGWSSNNKFALLGGIRASAQMISYEVTLGMTLVGLMIIFGTLRLDTMSQAQGGYIFGFLPNWGVFYQPFAIVAYFAAASAEIKRAPFDLPEGESEIVGYFIEYSGLKFGIFMIAEFVEVVVFAGLFTALFFGGWHIPYGEGWIEQNWGATALGFLQFLSFTVKTFFFCWLSLAVRWTFPRFRYDQVMNLGWKMLLPLSIANVLVTGVVTLAWGMEGAALVGLVELVVLVAWVVGVFDVKRSGGETLLPTEAGHGDAHGSHNAHGHAAH
jgi:NADH-quinone oxidoreductase subunit H